MAPMRFGLGKVGKAVSGAGKRVRHALKGIPWKKPRNAYNGKISPELNEKVSDFASMLASVNARIASHGIHQGWMPSYIDPFLGDEVSRIREFHEELGRLFGEEIKSGNHSFRDFVDGFPFFKVDERGFLAGGKRKGSGEAWFESAGIKRGAYLGLR